MEEARKIVDKFLDDKLRINFAISKLSEKEGWLPRFSARYFVVRRKSEATRTAQLSGEAKKSKISPTKFGSSPQNVRSTKNTNYRSEKEISYD